MAFVVSALLAVYAALAFAIVEAQRAQPGWALYLDIVALALVIATIAQYHAADRFLLRTVGAKLVSRGEQPALYGHVDRLSALAGIAPPRVAYVKSPEANAFAVGRRRNAVVITTSGLDEHLTAHELGAVLAHEISHIANGDAALMTAVTVPRTLGLLLVNGGEGVWGILWLAVWPLGLPLFAIGSLLSLTMSRYREFAADRGSALITGEPEALMSALTKLANAPIPHRDLRQLDPVEALCIVPTRERRFELLMDHPPLEKRLARLAAMARELGKRVGP